MRRCAVLLATLVPLLSLTAAAADEKEKASKAELEKVRGRWKYVRSETFGKEIPIRGETVVVVDGDKWTLETATAKGETVKVEWKFSIDPTQTPRAIDHVKKTEGQKDYVKKGIYKLDGDTLTVCFPMSFPGEEPKPRPKEFKTADGGQLQVFKRVEK